MDAIVYAALFVLPLAGVAAGVAFGPAIRAFIAVCVTDLKAAHKAEVDELHKAIIDLDSAKSKVEADLHTAEEALRNVKANMDAEWDKAKAEYEKIIAELKAKIESYESLIRGAVGHAPAATTPTSPTV